MSDFVFDYTVSDYTVSDYTVSDYTVSELQFSMFNTSGFFFISLISTYKMCSVITTDKNFDISFPFTEKTSCC